jgi:hypothetical protein
VDLENEKLTMKKLEELNAQLEVSHNAPDTIKREERERKKIYITELEH